jgi:hypothetical protein
LDHVAVRSLDDHLGQEGHGIETKVGHRFGNTLSVQPLGHVLDDPHQSSHLGGFIRHVAPLGVGA